MSKCGFAYRSFHLDAYKIFSTLSNKNGTIHLIWPWVKAADHSSALFSVLIFVFFLVLQSENVHVPKQSAANAFSSNKCWDTIEKKEIMRWLCENERVRSERERERKRKSVGDHPVGSRKNNDGSRLISHMFITLKVFHFQFFFLVLVIICFA